MDSAGYFIEGIYNQILLRDFVGKIVPGLVLFLSVAMAFRKRDYLLAEAKTHANALTVALLGGAAVAGGAGRAEYRRLVWHLG